MRPALRCQLRVRKGGTSELQVDSLVIQFADKPAVDPSVRRPPVCGWPPNTLDQQILQTVTTVLASQLNSIADPARYGSADNPHGLTVRANLN